MRKQANARPMLPVSLLVAECPCLVVGGGAIAARKTGHLLAAAATVTVVSPTACVELEELARTGTIRLVSRLFQDTDVDGQRLVIAATDSVDVNRDVLQACRAKGILCSAADSNWPQGDFVTPAIARKGGLVVTVSTGGRSCREAKIVKDQIAKLLSTITDESGGDTAYDDNDDAL